MEEKELSTTISASPVNSESDAAVTQPPSNHRNDVVVETNNNMSTGIVTTTTTTTEGLRFGSGATASFSPTAGKKRRGRPRKYDADGNLRVSYASPKTTPFTLSSPGSDQFSSSSNKRGRGRPSGSGNWQLLASLGEIFASTAGGDFTPHVVTVGTGEDVAGKILSFTEKGPRGICVLAANGSVSNVTIRQPGSSGGILTYEGRFEILSLTGSFMVTEISGGRSRTGGLSVSLAGPDGRVIGGGLAGLLTAASPIQIVVGSFMPNGYKVQKRKYNTVASDTVSFASPISQAKPAAEISNPTLLQQQPNVVVEVPQADHQKLTPTITTTSTTIMSSEKSNPNNGAAAAAAATATNFAAYNRAELARPDLGGHGHRSPDINMSIPGDL